MLKDVHENFKNYECEVYKCHRCERPFSRLKLVYFHIEKDHEGLNCYICERKFKKKSNLVRHVENLHSDVESHKCENVFDHDCPQAFEVYSDLRKHILKDHIMAENDFSQLLEPEIVTGIQTAYPVHENR